MHANRARIGPAMLGALALVGVSAPYARAQDNPAFLQWFEAEWDDVERRIPDFFLAGYNAVWLPPPSKASYQSAGYDPFDRFDLGKPPITATGSGRARTTYGTEESFGAMIDEFHRANAQVFVDGIFNHNSGRTTSDAFLAQGGWPGFWIPRESPPRNKLPTDDWGDFHAGNASGYLQSENPGGANYDLYRGDLVGLIDIAPEENNQYIRQPVEEGNPNNIPAGTMYNLPDAGNARFYPDQALTPDVIHNPGTSRNPTPFNLTRYPYNEASPLAGDAVTDNATGMLMRWAQWMLQVQHIDGFRLDAHKHQNTWFWDTYFDAAVHDARTDPWGNHVTPFNFGENVTGNFDMLNNYIRKDSFAMRDALDLNGAGRLREIVNAGGFGSWNNLFNNSDSGHLDLADDGTSNGTLGVNHVFSHDNGSTGNGGSTPPLPTARQQGYPEHAYMLLRPGRSIVYHDARGVSRSGGFFPREGVPIALGLNPSANVLDDTITTLVQLHNQLGRGQYFQLNSSINDVLVYERAINGQANCLVGVNDRYDAGIDVINVTTDYPQGTRLHEMTGNADDPVVDPFNTIPSVLTVGAGGAVSLVVPRNLSQSGVEHAKGYVVYAEALPSGTLVITNQSGVIDADPTNFPSYFRRLNDIPVVSADTFRITLNTSQTDGQDPNTDDNALFKIDAGTRDWNGNGSIDYAPSAALIGGYEEFLTIHDPTFGSGTTTGTYSQQIDATQLEEGFHYISVIAFRHRASGSPLFTEFREVVFIDRVEAPIEIEGPIEGAGSSVEFRFRNEDRTVTAMHAFLDLDPELDPVEEADIFNAASRWDRLEWRKTFTGVSEGPHVVTLVAFEQSDRPIVIEIPFGEAPCPADLAEPFGTLDFSDVVAFLVAFSGMDPAADLAAPFGQFDFSDVVAFLAAFGGGCP
ncbi:MAG: GC-type dockerin domain-anchored protein [Phycisphaerales bacterium]